MGDSLKFGPKAEAQNGRIHKPVGWVHPLIQASRELDATLGDGQDVLERWSRQQGWRFAQTMIYGAVQRCAQGKVLSQFDNARPTSPY